MGGKTVDHLIDGADWVVKPGHRGQEAARHLWGKPRRLRHFVGIGIGQVFAVRCRPRGRSNLLTFMDTTPRYRETFRELMDKRIGNPKIDQELLRTRSPPFAANKIEVPLFVAQGYNDPRVNHAEAEQIVHALKVHGKPVEYLVKMDEGHGFENPENRLDFYEKMEAFLEMHLL